MKRRYPVGAEIFPDRGVHFRLWAPEALRVDLILEGGNSSPQVLPMKIEEGGYFSLLVPEAHEGSLYRFSLNGDQGRLLADPASRFQPSGPLGPSCVVDPADFSWSDEAWKGIPKEELIIYELHIGTFTAEGTFCAAMAELEELAALGITAIELMPLADFPGDFGWGYDGVCPFAPTHLYGRPSDLKLFIDTAHSKGIAVILDVVYNHLGPEGNQLLAFSRSYESQTFVTEWGSALNFDEPCVREYFVTNVRYWIEEYHFDGLRFDATSAIFSSTERHILAEMTQAARTAAQGRHLFLVAENEPQDTRLLQPYDEGGMAFDALWNDDFHHSAYVSLTGKREAYYTDYLGTPQEILSAIKYGFLYQGQYYSWQKKNRGVPNLCLAHSCMVNFLENHDQIANSDSGRRLAACSHPGLYRALTALLLLGPNIPLLFQGQEYGATTPFYYFSHHSADLNRKIFLGRQEFLSQFPRQDTEAASDNFVDPSLKETFLRCKLNFQERKEHGAIYQMHRDLIQLRKGDEIFKNIADMKMDGAILGEKTLLLRLFGPSGRDRLLLINFGPDFHYNPCPEPLLVAGRNLCWELLWSSEAIAYGGGGIPPLLVPYWKILGYSATVLKTVSAWEDDENRRV